VTEVSRARKAAFRILLTVERGPAHSDDLLRGDAVNALSAADRNLTTTLVLGVLRWQIWLDDVFRPLLKRPNAKLDSEVLVALRLGAFQLLFLDRIPAHAAISESVELVKQAGHRFASGMVNAVLRKLTANSAHEAVRDQAPLEAASAAAYPVWMVERWVANYGEEAARAICRHGQTQPALTVRIVTPEVEDELARGGIDLVEGGLLSCARTVVAGDMITTDAFREGQLRIQDEGSQLIAELASANLNRGLGKILDACAAPGGKTLILTERCPEAHIVACEANPQRHARLRERLASHAARLECRLADASALEENGAYDLVLADVPCSGTGTLGRNPEIRHRLRVEDFARHAERQTAILRAALRAMRPGGRVVYSTCSLEPEENERVVAAVLDATPGARQVSLADSVDTLLKNRILTQRGAERLRGCLGPEDALRLLPGVFNTDGFFITLIEKFD
jgi:16S rRNA (cytosine967-C5)-methyltransferase